MLPCIQSHRFGMPFHSRMRNTKIRQEKQKLGLLEIVVDCCLYGAARKDACPDTDVWLNDWTLTNLFNSFGLAMPLLCWLENPNSFSLGTVTLQTGFLIRTSMTGFENKQPPICKNGSISSKSPLQVMLGLNQKLP